MAYSPTPVKCHITTLNTDGSSSLLPLSPPPSMSMGPMHMTYIYSTESSPLTLNNNTDMAIYNSAKSQTPLPMYPPPGGSTAAIIDLAPDADGTNAGYMHRSQTLDYAFVMEGELEMTTDGGESRVVRRGDVVVQRAAMHAWRNLSRTQGARMAVVGLGCERVFMGNVELEKMV